MSRSSSRPHSLMGKESENNSNHEIRKPKKRIASVYDAVAGRVGHRGFIDAESRPITSRNGFPARSTLLGPLEVLLRRVAAPTEGRADVYLAGESQKDKETLPDSDLLKAIHAYASDFYSATTPDGGKIDFNSLDETALIAMGVLIEEAATQVLGECGDMVLVEPEGFDQQLPESRETQMHIRGRVPRATTPSEISDPSSSSESAESFTPRKKRARHT